MSADIGRSPQAGASLIEVMVAIVVLSVGMLAYAGLHAIALKYGKASSMRAVATQLAGDYVDRMRANSVAAVNNAYEFGDAYGPLGAALPIPPCADPTNCTGAEIAAIDIAQWRNAARGALPGAGFFVVRDAAAPVAATFDFWVAWVDPESEGSAEVGNECPAGMGVIATDPNAPRCMHFRFSL